MTRILSIVLLLALIGCSGPALERAEVTPQRPTFSRNTQTTAHKTFEVESGVEVDPGDRFAFPSTLKYGISEDTEMFVDWPVYQYLDVPGRDREGVGDLSFGMRHRFLEETEDRPSAAIQMATKVPTGASAVSTGESDFFLAGIVTRHLGEVQVTGYYQLGLLGDLNSRGTDTEHGLALAANIPLQEKWAAIAELAGRFNNDRNYDDVFTTLGGRYRMRPHLDFDLSGRFGLSDDAEDFVVLAGVTYNFGGLPGSGN